MQFSDYDLVKQAQAGDREAIGTLYDFYYQKILGFAARRTGSVQAAADITSETFLKVMKNINKFVFRDIPFSAWVYRIATNEIANHFRQKKSYSLDKMMEESGFEIEDPKNFVEEFENAQKELERKNIFSTVSQKLRVLPVYYQEVISLRFFEKKKTREIADILGKSEGTVKSLLSRGIEKLREEMEVGKQ